MKLLLELWNVPPPIFTPQKQLLGGENRKAKQFLTQTVLRKLNFGKPDKEHVGWCFFG